MEKKSAGGRLETGRPGKKVMEAWTKVVVVEEDRTC